MTILNEREDGYTFTGDASVTNIIKKVYPDAWKELLKTLPKHYFQTTSFKHYPIVDGAVILPKNFNRLYSFKMTGWKNKAFETEDENSEKALLQQNEYTRGGIVRPVCVLTRKQPEPTIIEGFKVETDSDTEDFEYLIYNGNLYYTTGHLKGIYLEGTEYIEGDIFYRNGELYKVDYSEAIQIDYRGEVNEIDFPLPEDAINKRAYNINTDTLYRSDGSFWLEESLIEDAYYLFLSLENGINKWTGTAMQSVPGEDLSYILDYSNTGIYFDGETYYSQGRVIDYEPGLMDVMEVYPEKETVEEALYIANPSNDDEISDRLFEPLCKTAAQLVYLILEKEVKLW